MDTESRVKIIIADVLGVAADRIEDELAIGDIAEWDSLHQVQIISAIEEKFDFHFSLEEIMELEDVADIVRSVEEKAGK